MAQVVISPRFQIVIPKEIRKKFPIRKGQKMTLVAKGNIMVLMPSTPLKHYRGFIKGMKTTGLREKGDRP